jgi:hypothetical protein
MRDTGLTLQNHLSYDASARIPYRASSSTPLFHHSSDPSFHSFCLALNAELPIMGGSILNPEPKDLYHEGNQESSHPYCGRSGPLSLFRHRRSD